MGPERLRGAFPALEWCMQSIRNAFMFFLYTLLPALEWCRQSIRNRLALVTGLGVGAVSPAFAEVPAAVSTALSDAAADAATMGGLLVLIAVAVVGFMIGIKFIKRARGAA